MAPNARRRFSHVDTSSLIEGKLPYKEFKRVLGSMELEDIVNRKDMIKQLTDKFEENWGRGLGSESFVEDTYVRNQLQNCIFVGHVNTDLDSIAGAICAAELYGGVPARAEESFNGEVECALKYVGMDAPPAFSSLPGGGVPDANNEFAKVCLVDHNEVDQMTPALKKDEDRMKRVVGLIDHHCVAKSFCSPSPLFIDVRPWGSMCSIIFHNYLRNRVPLRKEIARLLLCAILSDTLNLRSGTTTPADRFSVALLSVFGQVDGIDELAMQLFTAKTNWIVGLGSYEMVRGDQKNFTVAVKIQAKEDVKKLTDETVNLSLAVLEVTNTEPVLKVAEELLTQIRVFKYEKGDYVDTETGETCHDESKQVHAALLFVVDTVRQRSVCLVAGSREKLLAERAFPEATWQRATEDVRSPSEYIKPEETLCDVGGLVSRKLDFVPRCTKALNQQPLPYWFTAPSRDLERLAKVMQSTACEPTYHDSVQVVWDKERLTTAVFASKAGAAGAKDAPQNGLEQLPVARQAREHAERCAKEQATLEVSLHDGSEVDPAPCGCVVS
eukprot:TRINITY_DN22643_c0_g1_i1.p1 TRINITY_DN22643_c0_g1~~TRINITY_DN22643_c0_g1_i1.p1  ORF type:complete len:555 (+),score=117.64 TRINITY_DN22643_c0_g1_i1:51-1715(+)